MATTNRDAAEKLIAGLDATLGDVDEARVQMLRSLADAVDRDPQNASLWREYRAVEADLRKISDGYVDPFAKFEAELETAS